MPLIERYLRREFVSTFAAVVIVLLLVSMGALFADLVQEIARGRVPASLLLSQLGLRTLRWLPLVLPLALFLGLLLSIGRLYADSEMAVLFSVGLGPKALWRPISHLLWPVVIIIACCSLWWGPWASNKAKEMIDTANKSFLIAGLEAGRFVELPGRAGILYVGELATDGTKFGKMFGLTERDGRFDVITAKSGDLVLEGATQRILRLEDGYRVEGSYDKKDYRLMHFEKNEIRVPDREQTLTNSVEIRSTLSLFKDSNALAQSELHWRIAMPIFALILTILALPLARSEPRQAHYGRLILAFLSYLAGMNLLLIGVKYIAVGSIPIWAGLWWLHLPMFALAYWLFSRDGKLPAPIKRSQA
ncbi:MAG: LPS export ABC transporter permease LptF [Arenimonas sp.]